MSSVNESGHAKNLANFETLISFCTGYGAKYNPSKPNLKLASLNSLRANAVLTLDNMKATVASHEKTTNDREVAFKSVKKLVTQVTSFLSACGAMDQTIDDAKRISSKIQGRRPTAVKKEEPSADVPVEEGPKKNSTSQQSYDMVTDHFAKLIKTISTAPEYTPNEDELKIETLNNILTDLRARNMAVSNSYTLLSNARISRDKVFYLPLTGIHDVSLDVKQYIKSVYTTRSPEYKQVSSMKFINFSPK